GGPYEISAELSPAGVLSNYDITYNTAEFTITKRPITVTADNNSKYCGQVDPGLTYQVTSGSLTFTDAFTGNVARVSGEGTGVYSINQGSLVLNPNYDLTFISGQFTINGVSIDASASGTPVQIGTAATLNATVTPSPSGAPLAGVSVVFVVKNEAGGTVFTSAPVLTNASGIATHQTNAFTNAIGVYKVTAIAGTGCASSVAYIPVYDPNDSFVTGGGWINSPEGAMPDNPTAVGKANFGFVSKYKKGSNQVDGNTEFQFNAGNINFKSTMHESGSLVISGGKATYRGTGTINGQPGYKFVVVAIDGNWNGGTNPDRFRIKITTATGGTTIYDNQIGKDENGTDATVLGNNGQGGGSIVIHEVKKGNKRVVADLIQVPWNTPIETVKKEVEKMSLTWFEAKKLPMTLQSDSYDPLTPGIYELKADLIANEFYSLDEPISIQVLVLNKPEALDIVVDNNKFASNLKSGEVLGYLNTIDPADNIHSYSLDENPEVQLNGNKLIWMGNSIPASLSLRVSSTDRAGQTISKEIVLNRELKPGEFFVYPNPASSETNILIDLDYLSGTVAIQIYDAIGRVVGENVAIREGRFTQTFNLDGLAAGMYTVQVRMGNMVMTKRLIIK
ncbi:Por secretion system C-terminal sorting domain-containing protein, partial [Algoriphagus ornithinivorans]